MQLSGEEFPCLPAVAEVFVQSIVLQAWAAALTTGS
jgi:hypothetical protein